MEDETRHRKRRRDELRTGIHSAAAQKSRAHPHDVGRRACASQLLFSAAANPTASRQTAGRDGAAVASRAYPRVARVRGSVSAAGARLVSVLASVSSRASFAAVHPFADISSRLVSPSSRQTASTRLRDGLLELAYPPDAAAHALDDVLVASAEESRRLGPDLAAASDVDARFLALIATRWRRVVSRQEGQHARRLDESERMVHEPKGPLGLGFCLVCMQQLPCALPSLLLFLAWLLFSSLAIVLLKAI